MLEARDAKGNRTLAYRADAAQLGRAASAALGYEQTVQQFLEFFSDDDDDDDSLWHDEDVAPPGHSLPLGLQAAMTSWLRGELTQQFVETEARENVRITETAASAAHAKRELEALTERLRAVAPAHRTDPALKLRGLARRYDRITTVLLGATEGFLSRWSRFHRMCWTPFEALMSAWIDPAMGEPLGRMAAREGRGDIIPPLLTEALEEPLARAREEASQLLDVLIVLCRSTHTLLVVAHVLRNESQAGLLEEGRSRFLRSFGGFYSSFTNACSPFFDTSGTSRDVPRLLAMLSAGEPTLRTKWGEFQEERTFALGVLEMSRRAEERQVRAHLRGRALLRENTSTDRLRRKRRRSPSTSSSSPSYCRSADERTE